MAYEVHFEFRRSAAVLFTAVVAWAGITGSISGTVSDSTGAVMSGVTVTVTSLSTNVQSTTVTDAKGFYSFPALNVDRYNVAVNQAGFKNFWRAEFVLMPIPQSRLTSSWKSARSRIPSQCKVIRCRSKPRALRWET